ncbi:hypothetical protein HBB16_14720 [Pseudonocardia sp. MCCB 268]|nr:hypothetical protein [Pseudonocardia cytotoxica]
MIIAFRAGTCDAACEELREKCWAGQREWGARWAFENRARAKLDGRADVVDPRRHRPLRSGAGGWWCACRCRTRGAPGSGSWSGMSRCASPTPRLRRSTRRSSRRARRALPGLGGMLELLAAAGDGQLTLTSRRRCSSGCRRRSG